MINESEIYEIYNYVKINYNELYANKYVPLPFELNNKKWKWEGKDFARVISLLEFREYMLEYNNTFNNVLTFSKNDPELEYLNYNNLYCYSYEEKKDFDFAMINQTIEHLYNPILSLKNIYNHMKVGGIFYTNVPSNSIPHDTPFHYYTGITPVGLGVMIKLAGFDILKIGQWGNKQYYNTAYTNIWSDYKQHNNPGFNDIECPIITWCLSIKNN